MPIIDLNGFGSFNPNLMQPQIFRQQSIPPPSNPSGKGPTDSNSIKDAIAALPKPTTPPVSSSVVPPPPPPKDSPNEKEEEKVDEGSFLSNLDFSSPWVLAGIAGVAWLIFKRK